MAIGATKYSLTLDTRDFQKSLKTCRKDLRDIKRTLAKAEKQAARLKKKVA